MVVGIALKFNRCIQCGALERCADRSLVEEISYAGYAV